MKKRSPLFLGGKYGPIYRRILALEPGCAFWVKGEFSKPEQMRAAVTRFARLEKITIRTRVALDTLYISRKEEPA